MPMRAKSERLAPPQVVCRLFSSFAAQSFQAVFRPVIVPARRFRAAFELAETGKAKNVP